MVSRRIGEHEMKEKHVWSGRYRGVAFEINNFTLGDIDAWTFYLYINTKQIKEKIWLKGEKLMDTSHHTRYVYEDTIINNLDWHCGCTYYEKHGGREEWENKTIQVGCDYQHLWDEHKHYTVEMIQADVERCIDSLHELTSVKYWCTYCGKYFLPTDAEHFLPIENVRCEECIDK